MQRNVRRAATYRSLGRCVAAMIALSIAPALAVELEVFHADSLAAPLATVTALGADTLLVGNKKQPVKHYTFEDPSARFELWSDAQGRLVRLVHPESGLRVERVPATSAAAPAHKPPGSKPPATKSSASKKASAGTAH